MSRRIASIFFIVLFFGLTTEGSCENLDLETWHLRNNEGTGVFEDVAYGGGVFVAVGSDPAGTIWRSADGENWTDITSGSTVSLFGATYGDGQFVVTGSEGEIRTSEDGGLTWNLQDSGVPTSTLSAAAYGNETFVAGGLGIIVYSNAETDWTVAAGIDPSFEVRGIAYGQGLFVAVGDAGGVITSSDGETWTTEDSPTTDNLTAVSYGNDMFIATGPGGMILTSSNGTDWSTATTGVAENLTGIDYLKGYFALVGESGVILYSTNGIEWTEADPDPPIGENLNGIAGGEYTFVAVGELGSIYQSNERMSLPLMMAPINASNENQAD